MSTHKDLVTSYVDSFAGSDHDAALACLSENVVWTLFGYRTITGKAAFEEELEHSNTPGRPHVTIDQLVEEGDTVIAIGRGEVSLREGGGLSFVFCDVYEFDGDLIGKLESYQVNLNNPSANWQ